MARRRSRSSRSVQPRRVVWMLALGVAVLGGTFAAGFSVGQQVPRELVPFFDTQTADAEEHVTIVAPAVDTAPVDEPATAQEPAATHPADEQPVAEAPAAQAPAEPAAAPEAAPDEAPAEPPTARVIAREPDAPAERRAVYVSAGGDGH